VVGIPNMGEHRLYEYSPFADARLGGGGGDGYVAFLERTVKPLVDRRFRTLREREATGLFGSSMGALISLYAFFRAPATFGFAGGMSPSIWFADRALLDYVEAASTNEGRLYLDVGAGEGPGTLRDARELTTILRGKGYEAGRTLQFVEDRDGRHEEAHWARRLVPALEFLLKY
jgi:predicted alpha/beta superfamily hydrolase